MRTVEELEVEIKNRLEEAIESGYVNKKQVPEADVFIVPYDGETGYYALYGWRLRCLENSLCHVSVILPGYQSPIRKPLATTTCRRSGEAFSL